MEVKKRMSGGGHGGREDIWMGTLTEQLRLLDVLLDDIES